MGARKFMSVSQCADRLFLDTAHNAQTSFPHFPSAIGSPASFYGPSISCKRMNDDGPKDADEPALEAHGWRNRAHLRIDPEELPCHAICSFFQSLLASKRKSKTWHYVPQILILKNRARLPAGSFLTDRHSSLELCLSRSLLLPAVCLLASSLLWKWKKKKNRAAICSFSWGCPLGSFFFFLSIGKEKARDTKKRMMDQEFL